ncbi:MAG: 30S ribosomal protein S9 [Parcubacteria group bacterium]
MAIKKAVEKENTKKEEVSKEERYFYAVGRRKTSVAKIKLFPSKEEQSSIEINEKKLEAYFPTEHLWEIAKAPLELMGDSKFRVSVKASGGGCSAQADAVRLGIARALVVLDETLKKTFKDKGYLTRDPREVERKKPGLKKARRAPQWAKR